MMMSRKKHRPYRTACNTFDIAISNAKTLSSDECNDLTSLFSGALKALREGVATEKDWCIALSQLAVSIEIEKSGVVRGMLAHFMSITQQLQAIYDRAMQTGEWRRTELKYEELDAMSLLHDLHKFQLRQISRSEYLASVNKAYGVVSTS